MQTGDLPGGLLPGIRTLAVLFLGAYHVSCTGERGLASDLIYTFSATIYDEDQLNNMGH